MLIPHSEGGVEQGRIRREMAELMGHSSVQITLDRYSHIMPHMAAALGEDGRRVPCRRAELGVG